MYYPHYKKDRRGIPIISMEDIGFIAERYVEDFAPDNLAVPQPFDVEMFMEAYLGLNMDYQFLSHNGTYLGMTVFNDTNKLPIYIPEENSADYIAVSHGTVIIDNSLLRNNQIHRYRFTVGHECGHWVFHREYYGYDPYQMSLFESEEYYQIKMVEDAKVLMGNEGRHSLPDFAHTPNSKYIKENADGSFREMREYSNEGYPIIEIGYHPEQSLTGNRHEKVLHFHLFCGLDREMGGRLSPAEHSDIYLKYKKYLEAYGL